MARQNRGQGSGVRGQESRTRSFASFVSSCFTLSAHAPGDRFRKPPRRGIVLLIVISLLALFVLIGVTFVLVSSHYVTSARVTERIDQVGDYPDREFDILISQLIHDTAARSAVRYHSLLEDLYSRDFVFDNASDGIADDDTKILAGSGSSQWNNQAYGFRVNVAAFQSSAPPGPLATIPDYYTGRILTFTEGPAKNYSGRILSYDPTPPAGSPHFVIELDHSSHRSYGTPTDDDHFLINGAPFNGTGSGYSANNRPGWVPPVTATTNMDALYDPDGNAAGPLAPQLMALLPHFNGYDLRPGVALTDQLTDLPSEGGADEAWDAVDFQNMFLAMVPPGAAHSRVSSAIADLPIIPSFHRPELISYWLDPANLPADYSPLDLTNADHRNFLRTFIFRPMPWDHPNFTGGNSAFNGTGSALATAASIYGTWDIDNDNDSVADSIWVDPGLPIVTSKDGKRYKRLVAILVKDLDSRANLNAHGNLSQLTPTYRPETPVTLGIATGASVPRGSGFGPAEVSFLNIFNADTGAYQSVLEGRYQSNTAGDNLPGQQGVRDGLSIVKHHGVPNTYQGQFSWYASPPDVWGRGAIALDRSGQPITDYMGQNDEMLDSPYELSLSGEPTNSDSPYTLVELERLLRFHDIDAQQLQVRPALVSAASQLATSNPGVIDTDHTTRERLTTISAHLPVPGTPAPLAARGLGAQITILDLYRARLAAPPPQGGGFVEPQLSIEFEKIVPWELRHGQLFDLNRWLGNGFDQVAGANLVPDDPPEALSGQEQAWSNNTDPRYGPAQSAPTPFAGTIAQHSNGIDVDSSGAYDVTDLALARQLYARHLYCLVSLFLNPSFAPLCPHEDGNPMTENLLTNPQHRLLLIRRFAQWSVNCVDFRDPDSVMTPFEYDANPWNGWQVDGNLATDGTVANPELINGMPAPPLPPNERGVVWGVEHPDLLISETLCFHDRRVKDTDKAGPMDRKRTDMPAGSEMDLDQLRVPEGSLFIEVYCPRHKVWNPPEQAIQKPMLPLDLYDGTGRLQLGKLAPDGRPVWRLALSELIENNAAQRQRHPGTMATSNPESASFDPENVNLPPVTTPGGLVNLQRFVYFGDASALPAAELDFSFYNRSATSPLLEGGAYAVIGPRPRTYLGSQVTAAGGPEWIGPSPQYVDIAPNAVTFVDTTGVPIPPTARPPVGIVADMQTTPISGGMPWMNPWTVGVNITEPLPRLDDYYPEPAPPTPITTPGANDGTFYDDPTAGTEFPGSPADSNGRPLFDRGMTTTGTYDNAASVFLQRLANPLQPWHPQLNPYITVDWASIDVTVFTGEEDTERDGSDGLPLDPDDDYNNPPRGRRTPLGTRQRGYPQTGPADSNFWNPVTNAADQLPASAGGGVYFDWDYSQNYQTLAFVNQRVGTPFPGDASGNYMGEPMSAGNQAPPWLSVLNRPFNSPYELLLVPSSGSSRLCYELTPGFTFGSNCPFRTGGADDEALRRPFGQLLNLFHSDPATTASPQLFRLLDFTEVGSPYVGAERWFNPSQFGSVDFYRPPFNKMSRFRDAGRININTIYDQELWEAAVSQFPAMAGTTNFYDKVFRSRQGFGGAGSYLVPNPAFPTLLANPFRTADASDLMVSRGSANLRKTNPVEATWLRPDPDVATRSLFDQQSAAPHNNTDRNPYFRYQGLQKLGNTFTTHSNVFAVWMTVGYFEVEEVPNYDTLPANEKSAWPDGYRLGQEVGLDSGEVKRHRAFFIIDRSIPVGYMPGEKLNSDQCILLKRFIE